MGALSGKAHWRATIVAGSLGAMGFVLAAAYHVGMVTSALSENASRVELPSTFVIALLWTCLASLIALIIGSRPLATAD